MWISRHRRLAATIFVGASMFAYFPSTTIVAAADLLAMPQDWKRLDVPDQPAAEFTFSNSGELTVTANKSVAFLYRAVTESKSRRIHALKWRWLVDRSFPPTDLTAKGKDDRPLAVHLWFVDGHAASVFGPLGWLFGYPHISHTVTYVLGGDHPPDSVLANPYYTNGAIFSLRGRQFAAGKWYSETRNIENDLARAFPEGPTMKTLKYVSVSADTDHTSASSKARITALTLIETDR